MTAKLSVVCYPDNLTLQALYPSSWSKIREHETLREKEDKDPSVSVVSEKSLTESDGDQLQAKVVAANTNLHFPNSIKTRGSLFPPLLYIF